MASPNFFLEFPPVASSGGGGGSIVIDTTPVVGGTPGDVLFVGPTGLVTQNDTFQYDPITNYLKVTGLEDTFSQASVAVNGRILIDNTGLQSVGWNGRNLVYTDGFTTSIDWGGSIMSDPSGVESIDWNFRTLIDSSGISSGSWDTRILLDDTGTAESLDWKSRTLTDSGGRIVANWDIFGGGGFLYDESTTVSIDWQNRFLEQGGDVSIDWGAFRMFDLNAFESIDWNARQLYTIDSTITHTAVDWGNRLLADSTATNSIDWQARQLLRSTGAVNADWSGANFAVSNNITYAGGTGLIKATASGVEYGISTNPSGLYINKTTGKIDLTDSSGFGLHTDASGNIIIDQSLFLYSSLGTVQSGYLSASSGIVKLGYATSGITGFPNIQFAGAGQTTWSDASGFGVQLDASGNTTIQQYVLINGATHTANSGIGVSGHWDSQGSSPSIAGSTGATVSVSQATDTAGRISLTPSGLSTAIGTQFTVTFAKPYSVAPIVLITPTNANSGLASLGFYVSATNTTAFSVANLAAITPSTVYTWNYIVIETK